MKNIYLANINQIKPGLAMLTSDEEDLEQRKLPPTEKVLCNYNRPPYREHSAIANAMIQQQSNL
jgi:hypothetical protein